MPYNPSRLGDIQTLEELRGYVQEELDKISKEFNETIALDLRTVHQEPLRPREGMLASADGVDWDPGDGAGTYEFVGGVWRRINGVVDGDYGDISISGGVWSIDADVVSNSKLANMAAGKVKARGTASTGDPEDISVGNGITLDATSLRTAQQMSITVDGSGLKLSGDASSPGNSKYYGTNSSGTKGFFDLLSGFEFIASDTTLNGTSTADFFNLSAYATLLVVFEDITSPAGNSMALRLSNDNTNFLSTAGDYDSQASDDSTGTTSTTGVNLTDGTSSGIHYGLVLIAGFNNSSIRTTFAGVLRKTGAANNFIAGQRTTAEANNALRLFVTPSNMTGGSIHLYGSRA